MSELAESELNRQSSDQLNLLEEQRAILGVSLATLHSWAGVITESGGTQSDHNSFMMLPITLLALLAPVLATLLDPFSFHLSPDLGGDGIERRQIRTCQGSLVFQTCPDGSSCAPPGFFCCGSTCAYRSQWMC